MASFIFDKAIAAAQLAILARLLTPADFGLMAASAVVLLAFLTLSEVGLEPALVTRRDLSETDLAVAWSLSLTRGVLLACCLWLLAGSIAGFFRTAELEPLIRVHAVALLIQGAQSPTLALLLRNLDLRQRGRLDVARRVVEAAVSIGLAFWLRSAWALLWGQMAGFAIGCILSFRVAPFHPRFSFARDSLQYFIRYGRSVNLTTILIFGVTGGGEFVVGRLLGTESLGLYQLAWVIPTLLTARVVVQMSQVTVPAFALLQRDHQTTVRAFAFQFAVVGLTLLPLSAALAFAAPGVVRLIAGEEWSEAAAPLRILSIVTLCGGLSGIMASLHYGLGRPELQTRIWMIQFAVYAVTVLPLTSAGGLSGAAWASSLCYAVGFGLHLLYTARLLGADARSVFSVLQRATLPVAGVASVGLVVLHARAWALASWPVVVWAGAGLAVYLLYLWKVEYPRLAGLWSGRPGAETVAEA